MRTAIGDDLVTDAGTLTWTRQIEGDPWRIISEISDFPYIIHRIGDSHVGNDPTILPITLSDTVSVMVETSSISTLADSRYKAIRTVGELVISNIMTAGVRLGTSWLTRRLGRFGVEYDLTAEMADLGVMVYEIEVELWYGEYEVSP
jgi:hypothetical protein